MYDAIQERTEELKKLIEAAWRRHEAEIRPWLKELEQIRQGRLREITKLAIPLSATLAFLVYAVISAPLCHGTYRTQTAHHQAECQ